MIDKDLHSALFELEKSLNELKSAKQQIEEVKEIGNSVVKAIAEIQINYSQHLKDLKADYSERVKKFHEDLTKFKNELEVSYKKTEKLSNENLKKSKEAMSKFLDSQKKENEKTLLALMTSTKKLIDDLLHKMNNLISGINEAFGRQNGKIEDYLEHFSKLAERVQNFVEIIEKIDFPNRLEKLDTTIVAVYLGIQNLQTKINDLERGILTGFEACNKNINVKHSENQRYFETTKNEFQEKINKIEKQQLTSQRFNITLLIINITLGALIVYKLFS